MFSFIAPLLLLAAFILLLLVTLSVPIIKTIFLFTLSADVDQSIFNVNADATGSVKFGVWGYCTSGVQVAVASISRNTAAECSRPRLGYTFDETVTRILGVDDIADSITKASTAALVIHPIACGLTFLTLVVSLFMLRRGSNGTARLPSFLTLGVGILAALLTTVVFLIDVIVVAVVRKRVKDASDGDVTMTWGNGVWMVLGATVALWLALVGACAGVCGCGRRSRKADRY